jgi:hypothetical protein
MKKNILVLALTRMHEGRICIGGIFENTKEWVRPVLPHPGISRKHLWANHKLQIRLFGITEFDLEKQKTKAPHAEDWKWNIAKPPKLIKYISNENYRKKILDSIIDNKAEDIIENQSRSLGIIKPKKILGFVYSFENKLKLRLSFIDNDDKQYKLPITDLNWSALCFHLFENKKMNVEAINRYLSRQLKGKEVYLGIGKGRPWAQDVQEEKKIYNLAISILTIPDYAGIRTYYGFEKMLGREL